MMEAKEITELDKLKKQVEFFKTSATNLYEQKATLQQELEKAKELIKELINAHVVNINESGEPKASLNELIELHKKSTTFLEAK